MTDIGARLAAALDLQPLPDEGGLFRQTFADDRHSTILFLLTGGDFSALHRLSAPEEYFFLAGAPLQLTLLDDDGAHEIGLDRITPLHTVRPGTWQGSTSSGDWTLVSTQVTPAFDWAMFDLGNRRELQEQWPIAAARIAELTRDST